MIYHVKPWNINIMHWRKVACKY